MRAIIYIAFFLFPFQIFAQGTLTVIGKTDKALPEHRYILNLSLQEIIPDGYQIRKAVSISDVKDNFISELKSVGLDFDKFENNLFYEFSMAYGQQKAIEYYQYMTSDKEEIRKIKALADDKTNGTSILNIEITCVRLSPEELAELSSKSIADAKNSALLLAKKLNKNIGRILSIEDKNSRSQTISVYGTLIPQTHSIKVTFELK